MEHYCFRCGVWALLSLVTYWCRTCADTWDTQSKEKHA